jgi:hypothetical protein
MEVATRVPYAVPEKASSRSPGGRGVRALAQRQGVPNSVKEAVAANDSDVKERVEASLKADVEN